MTQNMARMGRYGDNQMAHVAPGEKIVPTNVLNNRPDLARGINSALMSEGMDPRRYTVGTKNNSNNPNTGLPEFFSWSDAWDIGKRILSSPAGSAANYRMDMSTKGPSGGGADSGQAAEQALSQAANRGSIAPVGQRVWNKDLLGYGEIASKLAPGLGDESNFFGSLLNSKAGEALVSGLGAQLLSSLFDKEEVDEGAQRAQRPFGFGDRRVSVNTIRQLANGGSTYPAYYPRRNGGIMPNEGSGTRDDVPAMLTAGEFVLTKDAVKGLGGGNERTGIENAYRMQRKLEGMA